MLSQTGISVAGICELPASAAVVPATVSAQPSGGGLFLHLGLTEEAYKARLRRKPRKDKKKQRDEDEAALVLILSEWW